MFDNVDSSFVVKTELSSKREGMTVVRNEDRADDTFGIFETMKSNEDGGGYFDSLDNKYIEGWGQGLYA